MRAKIDTLIGPSPKRWAEENGLAWEKFANVMLTREYGPEELTEAWQWFMMGWAAHRALPTLPNNATLGFN